MWSTAFYFGNFIGPTVAGIVVEKYGFRATTIGEDILTENINYFLNTFFSGFFALNCGIFVVDIFEFLYNVKLNRQIAKAGYEQLE